MKDFGKDFDTIDQARTRPIEIGRSVDSVKLSTPSRQKSSTPVFFDCPLERKSARHEDDDFGLSFQDPFGRNAFGFRSPLSEHLVSAGNLHHLRNPMPRRKGWIKPFHGVYTRTFTIAHPFAHTTQPGVELLNFFQRCIFPPVSSPTSRIVSSISLSVVGSRETMRVRPSRTRA